MGLSGLTAVDNQVNYSTPSANPSPCRVRPRGWVCRTSRRSITRLIFPRPRSVRIPSANPSPCRVRPRGWVCRASRRSITRLIIPRPRSVRDPVRKPLSVSGASPRMGLSGLTAVDNQVNYSTPSANPSPCRVRPRGWVCRTSRRSITRLIFPRPDPYGSRPRTPPRVGCVPADGFVGPHGGR